MAFVRISSEMLKELKKALNKLRDDASKIQRIIDRHKLS